MPTDHFPPEVIAELQTYVYRLIAPRNGETFYVGKGKANRVFAHARADIEGAGDTEKLQRIRQIRRLGFEVAHVIHRHGLNEAMAYEVEAALIDCYPGLTNLSTGHGSSSRGVMHADEVMQRYCAEEADFKHRVLLINVNRTADESDLYEATRYAWKISPARARKAEFVLAVQLGLIVGCFVADAWYPATREFFPRREPVEERWGFVGRQAPDAICKQYVGKRMPDRFRKRGAANPVKYGW